MYKVSWILTNHLVNRDIILADDADIYAFGFQCLLSKIIITAIVFVLALLLDALVPIALFTLCFWGIKKHIGGWHAESELVCFLTSIISVVAIPLLCRFLPVILSIPFILIAFVLVIKLAPAIHRNNPKTEEQYILCKKKVRVITLLYILINLAVYFSPLRIYAIYLSCGLMASALTLLIPNARTNE